MCDTKATLGDNWFAHSIEELVIWTVQRHYGKWRSLVVGVLSDSAAYLKQLWPCEGERMQELAFTSKNDVFLCFLWQFRPQALSSLSRSLYCLL